MYHEFLKSAVPGMATRAVGGDISDASHKKKKPPV
jgi:hypothetical protein